MERRLNNGGVYMIRLARDSFALASVGGFVWMVCTALQMVR